ncbi:hypothetical protein X797_002516 [Metarhizium robertsii]|uniref:Uncharacterized protein n=2 Tax=Metarhizium robertsii TaxID=568076 RepID=E9EYW2_METRA|nr:uncharacterized protein MAA_05211 [Metarhizium robertsii ARSEF 23]EFY99153.1 hypothetical protein MAA_05211 [Metarhizium robertsii ARSEF 23]EXV04832.1 hypothetical protein X797_002516 [Metarhizium robertsii]
MDRARRTAATTRRKTLGDSTSPQSTPPESISDHPSASPVMAHASAANSPQPATQSRRGSKSLHHTFTFSTPASGNRGQGVKRRSRTMDSYGIHDDEFDDDSPRKGGHTLRKRARVDYTFEHVDDEVVVPSSTSSARAKKRKSDHSYDSEEFYASGAKRRGASLGADASGNVRRNPARSSALGRADHGDDEDVKDTIEVGVSFSDMDESEVRRDSHSSTSSAAQSLDGSWKSAPTVSNFGGLYPNDKSTNNDERPNAETRDMDIDPNLRASPPPPSSKQPAATIEPIEAQSESTDTPKVNEPANVSSDKAEEKPELSDTKIAEIPNAQTLPVATQDLPAIAKAETVAESEPLVEEQTEDNVAPTSDVVVSDEMKDRTSENNDLVSSEPPKESEVEQFVKEPVVTEPSPLKSQPTTAEPIDISPAKQSPSVGAVDNVASEEATTLDANEDSNTKGSPPAETPLVVPSISVEEVMDTKMEDLKDQEAPHQERKSSPESIVTEVKDKVVEDSDTLSPEKKEIFKPKRTSQLGPSKPQPAPVGRWAYLTPYMDGEYVSYPEKKARSDDEAGGDETTPDDKDGDKDGNDMEPMIEDNDDAPDPSGIEAPTPALNTPTRGSPVPDSMDPTATNSPAPAGDDADDGDESDSQEVPERKRYYKYRKTRDPEEYISAIENYEDMTTAELYEILEAINISLVQWQTEWLDLGRLVDDHENSQRRRLADAKYESRTRNPTQHGVNHEEPDFAVKGYKAKERELMSETRYLQGQDRIMAATYGFEYDPHPSKIGRQNPETQQVGIMTRGRSLRNQPRQTVKASEADEVTGKRQRKPVQLFDPATQDVSRSSTPVPTRGRRRRNAGNVDEGAQVAFASSFNGDGNSEAENEAPKTRRRRGPRASNVVPGAAEEFSTPRSSDNLAQEETGRSGRRRGRQPVRYDETYAEFMDDDSQPEPKQRKRHMLTLKIPRSKNFSEPSSAITDNGDSRPSTASSESSSHTAESSYSFRPKRQKRFRDDPDETDEAAQAPPRKRGKRSLPQPFGGIESSFALDQPVQDAQPGAGVRKVAKIKVVRPAGDARNGTPSSQLGDDKPKDYKNMTKSEKMSASMKSRWANGNMAGAVEKRKATLAAKKAAQAAAEQKLGVIAPKPKVKPSKKEPPPPGQSQAGYVPAMPGINYPFPSNQ